MAENLARRTEIPAYDTYPAPAAPEELRMRSAQDVETGTGGNAALHQAAEKVGTAVGRAVAMVREIPQRMSSQRFGVIRGGGGEGSLSQKASEAAESAKERVQEARTRVTRLAHEKPIHFIAGAAAAAFVLGALMRIWRSHRG